MDAYEATKIVLQRIQSLDPENASKIMGLLLIQDHGEKEMIRLALGPEALVHSVIFKARNELILQSNSPSRRNSTTSASCRFFNGGNLPSPLSIPIHSSFRTRDDLISPSASAVSYAAIASNGVVGNSFSAMNSSASPFHGSGEADLVDEFDLPDQFSFLNDGTPMLGPRNAEMFYSQQDSASSPSGVAQAIYAGGAAPNWGGSVNSLQHRRSCSVSDISLLSDDSNGGLGWKPCLYFARGYCKNGTSCRFLHGGGFGEGGGLMGADNAAMVGPPTKFDMLEQCQELLRSKSARQQQRLAAASQLMASANFSYSSVAAADECMNFLLQQQQLEVESPRSDFRINGGPIMVNPGSRQIYLTFPADSSFKEEDVSNYFSIYGPVQDVRIPYQQKRMFGFVTFLYSETVKIILAKGNPHFVCDSRVLVKPYKEKGKVPDKFRKLQQQQHAERGEFGGCGSPTGLESRDAYDFPLGAKMFYDAQEVLWRRKMEEEADLQQAIELQNRRLMGLQLLDLKRNNHHRTLSTGAIVSSPIHSIALSSARSSPEKSEDNVLIPKDANLATVSEHGKGENDSGPPEKESDLQGSLEHNLPDNPFASPKAAGQYTTAFSNNALEAEKAAPVPAPSSTNNDLTSSCLFPSATSLDIAPLKSCYFLPSFTPGHGTVGM